MSCYASVTLAAKRWHEDFRPNQLTARPTRHLVVLACMDARLDLFRLLGLDIGDAHILRNAGGRATDDAVRSVVLSASALDTREVVVIHHTGCGLHARTNPELREAVRACSGHDPQDIDFLPFDDVAASVHEDVARLRACAYLPPEMVIWGAVYDVSTGELSVVDPPTVEG